MTAAATTDDLDVEALTRAIAICRAESEDRRKQVDEQLAERDWWDVGVSCSYHCQMQSLALPPWRHAPMFAHVVTPRPDEQAIALRRRMVDAGLSIYEPLPLAALDAVERRRKSRPSDVGVEDLTAGP